MVIKFLNSDFKKYKNFFDKNLSWSVKLHSLTFLHFYIFPIENFIQLSFNQKQIFKTGKIPVYIALFSITSIHNLNIEALKIP